jgi:hypothetical protein
MTDGAFKIMIYEEKKTAIPFAAVCYAENRLVLLKTIAQVNSSSARVILCIE